MCDNPGKLENGQVFDSSLERKKPFQFKLGNNDVILGWDKGVATMNKGEVCLVSYNNLCNEKCLILFRLAAFQLTIKPDYAYGRTAVGPIPANSTLYFEIELLGWSEGPAGLDSYLNWAIYFLTTVVICMAGYIYFRNRKVIF